jgi:hypothetical protein
MKRKTLRFPTLAELHEFELIVNSKIIYNKTQLEITANFSEADIELALAGYRAVVVEEPKVA